MSNRLLCDDVLSAARFERILESDEKKLERAQAWYRKHGPPRIQFLGHFEKSQPDTVAANTPNAKTYFGLPNPTNAIGSAQALLDSTSGASYTFSAIAFTPQPNQIIVVGAGGNGAAAATMACTIGGSAANVAARATANTRDSAMFFLAAPAASGFTVVISNVTGFLCCGIGVWAIDGLYNTGATYQTPVTGGSTLGTAIDLSQNCQISLVLIGYVNSIGTTRRTYTWVGINVDFDAIVDSGDNCSHSGASLVGTTNATPLTINATPNAAPSNSWRAICAAWY